MKLETKLAQKWDGLRLRETVKCAGTLYSIVTGQRNGGGENCVYAWSEMTGWNRFISWDDVVFDSDVSYVSSVDERKKFAEDLNKVLKDSLINLN